jgi:hypothetical protein
MGTPETTAGFEHHGRLLARLVRAVLARESFDTVADVTEALKVECARLKIGWTNDAIAEAYRIIESNRPLVGTPRRSPPVPPPHVHEDVRPVSRDEARNIVGRLRAAMVRTGQAATADIQTMPAVRQLSNAEIVERQWQADQRKAYQVIQQQILDTAQRAAALEEAIETADEEG